MGGPLQVNINLDAYSNPALLAPLPSQRGLNYRRVSIHEARGNFLDEDKDTCRKMSNFLKLRKKYRNDSEAQNDFETQNKKISFVLEDGVFHVYTKNGSKNKEIINIPTVSEFHNDLRALWNFCCNGAAGSFSLKRLQILEKFYELHTLMNADIEREGLRNDPVDFFSIFKVDNHIHAAAMMTGPHLLRFIRKKVMDESETIKIPGRNGGQVVTVKQFVEEQVGIPEQFFTLDSLNVQGDETVFERFDNFNAHYNPFGKGTLRDLFLKADGPYQFTKSDGPKYGKFFGEIIREVLDETEMKCNTVLLEPRLSIYGKSEDEWDNLAKWMTCLAGDERTTLFNQKTKWLIQFPRIFRFIVGKSVKDFQEYVNNLFKPLFEVTLCPQSHPHLAKFLEHVVGFDSVDDESPFDELLDSNVRLPSQFTTGSPAYSYFAYYMWANIFSLNHLRKQKGLHLFSFRPHAGEAGQVHHLATTFLLADGINHGIMLKSNHTLTYLYYLAQIGMSISPLSNHALFLPIEKNPFGRFHAIGLNVTLSTDDPLQFHNTSEPLIEEYTTASKIFKLSTADLAEIAMRSVRQSGWSHQDKCEMLGSLYYLPGAQGNDKSKTNIPLCRSDFRYVCFREETQTVWNASHGLDRAFKSKSIERNGTEQNSEILCPEESFTPNRK